MESSIGENFYIEPDNEDQTRLAAILTKEFPVVNFLPPYYRTFINPDFAAAVDFYLLPLCEIPSGNGKLPSMYRIVYEEKIAGTLQGRTWHMATSANAGAMMAVLARIHDFEFVAVVDPDPVAVPRNKRGQIEIHGSRIVFPESGESPRECAERLGSRPGCGVFDQYEKHFPAAVRGHRSITWERAICDMRSPKVFSDPSVAVVPVGTMSLLFSARRLQEEWPNLKLLGVAVAEGEIIPGARSISRLQIPKEKYESVINPYPLIEVGAQKARKMMMRFHQRFTPGGFTTGMTFAGTCDFLNEAYRQGGLRALESFRNGKGRIVVLLPAVDASTPYLDQFSTT